MSKLLKCQYFITQNIVFSLQSWLGGLCNAVPLYQFWAKKTKGAELRENSATLKLISSFWIILCKMIFQDVSPNIFTNWFASVEVRMSRKHGVFSPPELLSSEEQDNYISLQSSPGIKTLLVSPAVDYQSNGHYGGNS